MGIGEDGAAGLPPAARAALGDAACVFGGERQLALAAEAIPAAAERLPWAGLEETLAAIAARSGQRVVVLASGDPMLHGIGATLARRLPPGEMTVVPHVGAFSLAAARLGWPLDAVETLTLHGRPLAALALHLAPEARLLALSEDGATPAAAAALLVSHGFGQSRLAVFEHMGGPAERRHDGMARDWGSTRVADLNTLAITCAADDDAAIMGRVPGLPDDAYTHDGQLTKREVRAITLAALEPWAGALLWDIGAGAGSIAIEWLRAHPHTRAVAVERDPGRLSAIAANAARLGVPRLAIVQAEAPDGLSGLPGPPDAVFVGGNVARPGLLEACWTALSPGGRLVANAVTLEAEARLLAWRETNGGDLVRIAISRLRPVGGLTGWDSLAPVTQYRGRKVGVTSESARTGPRPPVRGR
ncbi:MAG: precorrin-6y C5,15-methyltransferase (decarboxylating) subunit CbiE [Alphaproteobacteria bacterium]